VKTPEQERDELREEVLILRECVSQSLYGSAQGKANAYAALVRLDARRREAALKEGAK
jgi:hypothetical protein